MRKERKNLKCHSMKIEKLKKFRQTAYQLLGNGKDATMDLMDAVLVTRSVYSFVELSSQYFGENGLLCMKRWKIAARFVEG